MDLTKLKMLNWVLLGMNIMCMLLVIFGISTGLIPSNIRMIILGFQLAICIGQGILCIILVREILREK